MHSIPMKKTFETTPMKILIEELSYTNSAFGITEEGVKVFLNSRMVDRLNIEVSDIIIAHCIPNYEDKRDNIPWRCVRAEKIEETIHDINERVLTEERIREYMKLDSHEDHFLDAEEVADDLRLDVEEVQKHFDDSKNEYEIVQCYRRKKG